MSEEKTYTESQAERFFAIDFHGKTWKLLEKTNRTASDDELLLDYVHASLAHWRVAGTPLNLQRGLWFLSRVYNVLGQTSSSLYYAGRCQEVTIQHKELMEDFDSAFAYEALARANAQAGNKAIAQEYYNLAESAGNAIHDDEDRKIFQSDLTGGNWFGLK